MDLPITKPPKLAIALIVTALIEPDPVKLVVPEPLQVNAVATFDPFVNELPNGAIVSVPLLVIVVVLVYKKSPSKVIEPAPTLKTCAAPFAMAMS